MKILKYQTSRDTFKVLALLLLCLSPLEAFFSDVTLPKVTNIKILQDRNSIGFEWKSLAKYANVQGVNVYRAKAIKGAVQTYTKIDAIANRFATHYVDTTARAGVKYFYTFTTFSGLNESLHGDIIPVKTKPPYKAVKFVEATLVDRGIVKLLWVPSAEKTVTGYIIERKCNNTNSSKWELLKSVKGRLYPEYIDTHALRGYRCSYRIFARDAVGLSSYISKVLSVEVR